MASKRDREQRAPGEGGFRREPTWKRGFGGEPFDRPSAEEWRRRAEEETDRFARYERAERTGSWRRRAQEETDRFGRYGEQEERPTREEWEQRASEETDRYGFRDPAWTPGAVGGRARPAGWAQGMGPRYRRPDHRIREELCERLMGHGLIDPSDVDVSVAAGVVTLQGAVVDRRTKHLIEDVAASIAGVQDVRNEIRVSPPPPPEL